MSGTLNIRQSTNADTEAINQLVTEVIVECYGHLLPDFQANSDMSWANAWVGERNEKVIAVLLTVNEWIDDLWIAKSERHAGIGSRLLAIAEQEIAARGKAQARLRLVAENAMALNFYVKSGWQPIRQFTHEKFAFDMIELAKSVSAEVAC